MPEIKHTKDGFTRRRFLFMSWTLTTLAVFGQSIVGLWEMLKPRIPPGGFGGVVKAGNVDEFEAGSVNHVQVGRFYLIRVDEGFLALWQRCTHLGCIVPWDEEAGEFRCPCHSSVFNTRGEVMSGAAPRPMDLFPIEIRDGEILVDTGQIIERDEFAPTQATSA